MPLDFTSLATWALSSAAARSHQVLQAGLVSAGASGYEFRCLSALSRVRQMSQIDLGSAAALDPRDVTHTVRALESRGLVSRVRDPRHGRRQLVSLTPDGQLVVEHLSSIMEGIQDAVFHRLTLEERSTLVELLDRVGRA